MQGIVGSILYYASVVDLTVLAVLSTIASEQAKATKTIIKDTGQLLDYLATHPDAKIRLYASNIILNVHYDALYLSIIGTKSQMCGHFFLGWMLKDKQFICLNGCLCSQPHPEVCGSVSSRGGVRCTIF